MEWFDNLIWVCLSSAVFISLNCSAGLCGVDFSHGVIGLSVMHGNRYTHKHFICINDYYKLFLLKVNGTMTVFSYFILWKKPMTYMIGDH